MFDVYVYLFLFSNKTMEMSNVKLYESIHTQGMAEETSEAET
jgi:hypothetical protein